MKVGIKSTLNFINWCSLFYNLLFTKVFTYVSIDSYRFILPPLCILCIDSLSFWASNLFMNNVDEFLYFIGNDFYDLFMRFDEEILFVLCNCQLVSYSLILDIMRDFSIPTLSNFFLGDHLCRHNHLLIPVLVLLETKPML